MSWDSENDPPELRDLPPAYSKPPMNGRDLEAIVCLLELGALSLTPIVGAEFTREELIAEAREIGGPEICLEEVDIDIVLPGLGWLLKKKAGKYLMR